MFKKSTLYSLMICIAFAGLVFASATNYDRLVLGSGNYGEDPNPTADITGANDEYWSNATDGQWSAGAANLLTTGTLGCGALTATSVTNSGALSCTALTASGTASITGAVSTGALTAASLVCTGVASVSGYTIVFAKYSDDPNAASFTQTITGLDADDIVLATVNKPTNGAYLLSCEPYVGGVTVTLSADPAASVDVSFISFQD